MGEFSTRMAATALRLITAKGELIVLGRATSGGMTASRDRVSTSQPSDVRAVMLPGDGEALAEGRQESGKVLLAAVSPPPKSGDTVTFPASSLSRGAWAVDKVKNYAPEGELIYSELEVSR